MSTLSRWLLLPLAALLLAGFGPCEVVDDDTATPHGAAMSPSTTAPACEQLLLSWFREPACWEGAGWTTEQANTCAAGSVWLTIDEAGADGPREEHPMGFDHQDGNLEVWSIKLEHVANPADVEPGLSTQFDCTDDVRSAELTFAYSLYDDDGVLASCVAYGRDPGRFPDCEDANAWW